MGSKNKDFPFFPKNCSYTDDTVMTIAVAEAFLESESFEDVIRTAVSLGGDRDTLPCIAGSIAEGFYGVPENLKQECRARIPEDLLAVLHPFDRR